MTANRIVDAMIEADPDLPIIRITRDFTATPAQLLRAHTDPELFAQWVGPDGVALETLRFDDLGDGTTRMHAQSLVDSFEGRDAWLVSGMEVGVDQGYAKLDAMLADGVVA